MSERNLAANVSISRFQSNMEPREGITIRVADELSGLQIVEVTMTAEEFGRAVTGLAYAKGVHNASTERLGRLVALVGKKVRAETILWPFDPCKEKRGNQEVIDRAELEIKKEFGCVHVRTNDLFNHHQTSKEAPGHQEVVVWFYDNVSESEGR